MANEIKMTTIEVGSGELEKAKTEIDRVLAELWQNKVESHYISLKYEGTEYWLDVNTKNPQILFSADRTALLPFIRNIVKSFFADKITSTQEYFKDVDLDQRLNNTKYGTFVFDGVPQQRLANAHVEKVMPSPGRHGLFSQSVSSGKMPVDLKNDEPKKGPQQK